MEDATKYREVVALDTRRSLSEQRNKLYRQGKQDQESIKREILSRIAAVHDACWRGTEKKFNGQASVVLKRVLYEQEKRFTARLHCELSTHDFGYYERTLPKIVENKVSIVRSENKILDDEIKHLEVLLSQSRRNQRSGHKNAQTDRMKPIVGKSHATNSHPDQKNLRNVGVAKGRFHNLGDRQAFDSSMDGSSTPLPTSSQIRTQKSTPYQQSHLSSRQLGDASTDKRIVHYAKDDIVMDDFDTNGIVSNGSGVNGQIIASKEASAPQYIGRPFNNSIGRQQNKLGHPPIPALSRANKNY
jgi:hypothetical protein